ncbi:MAG TPA: flagellar assembly protein FliX [Stellaceae bacterium]|nr:flagellar assembly protein FliX [Stellaceae bacterium]
MRIEGSPPVQATAPRREARPANGGSDFASSVETEAPPRAASATTLTSIDGLFALQEVADELSGRRRAAARGNALLDRLEDLRLALLSGHMPREQLLRLRDMAREHGPAVDDPKLANVLAEIELRVAVELAKLDTLA